MKIQDILQETYTALSANKARSGLTILGIVIGIGSVIAMVSIGQGAAGQIQSSIEGLGSNLLTVMPGFIQPGRGIVSSGRGSAQTLKNEDIEVLRQISGTAYISPEVQRRFQIVAFGNNTNSTIVGVEPDYAQVRNISPSAGSFITDSQVRSMGRVAVLGPTVAQDLFGEGNDPIGKTIRINRVNFKVIGVLQSKGSAGFFNPDDTVFVPLTTMQKILVGDDFLSTIAISVQSKDLMPQVQEEAIAALIAKHRVDPQSPDFSIVSQADILGTLTQVTDTFTIFLAAVAGISLIVGGIGIMNMMLTTVTERTREIGLRKSIGAKKKDISMQFLAEAVMLTFLGGVIGVALGWTLSILVSSFAGIATSVSFFTILLAFGVSAAIGIIFGYYPARRAASLNPIEALRYE
ncbi:MAG: ABC transporter, permease protein [Candidatus Azambacteria bacterium GW2011_GWE1_42_9]|nr:MAG: ABC transporter, permease protein [Candidatus Azambacteria bacterium GW2011_GWF1_41_10]KKS49340.1 MAG: ABC transporter, permease protein [Candidatus Azambacteria bacterium GW2011_GWF2_42_22]KKS79831.1 MAG: ABC transporter, permease protein [Candidatus Azambacteria bacterium GW2011_GWE1_42_9]KKT03451.1 MAG: ABC transporter, permease protein [Candidatus Azambacteria bacterium GW2011_GWD1_43_18]KKT12479.1 MAG: ABC transporter, permease protein [Candidatus Azambacteria bacterium GW2011_GWC2